MCWHPGKPRKSPVGENRWTTSPSSFSPIWATATRPAPGDRLLVVAESNRIPALLVLNKVDLLEHNADLLVFRQQHPAARGDQAAQRREPLGLCLLVARRAEHVLLPLVAAGSMTLTLYSAHLLGLFLELHYEQPVLWFLVHVLVGTVFAVLWHRTRGQGPLERVVGRAAHAGRDRVLRHRLNS